MVERHHEDADLLGCPGRVRLGRVSVVAVTLTFLACSGGAHDAPAARPTVTALAPVVSAGSADTPVRERTPLEAILEKRTLFARLDGDVSGLCEPLTITLPDLLDESHGRLLVPWAGPGTYELPFTVEGPALELSGACVNSGKSSLCLPCDGAGTVAAYARADACEARAESSVPLSGCVVDLSEAARARRLRTLDGSAAQTALANANKSSRVSLRRGDRCDQYIVAKTPGGVRFDAPGESYRRSASRAGALFVFEEEAEANPRAHPSQFGLGEIAIGCCDGARYLVLAVDERHATLRQSRPGTRDDGAIAELLFQRGCD